ncbi:hypothetical protein GFL88_28610 [Rhizobium leguminosarum bv. viciae]|uniref:DUF6602 domain-containing protein n=1 Tax=Rhizobium leguminosarum TaxID=384 RepID=UPI0014422AAD|nr:DUF6602 domain-containing protein [Rhizobium leguminosarum]NKK67406.1 hypothetical protein [Rhizobium leguminosarum bv. viciae]
MSNQFRYISDEFLAKSKQLKEIIRSHGPTIGTGHEVLLRSFLQTALPKWVSVGHGFIVDNDGKTSKECDVIIYNSTQYSPIYKVDDFVVVPPEAVHAVVEVKTRLSRKSFFEAMENIRAAKRLSPQALGSIFVYYGPKTKTLASYIRDSPIVEWEEKDLADHIYLFPGTAISLSHVRVEAVERLGYLNFAGGGFANQPGYAAAKFFFDQYSQVEMLMNDDLRFGIDLTHYIDGENPRYSGRGRFTPRYGFETELVAMLKELMAEQRSGALERRKTFRGSQLSARS